MPVIDVVTLNICGLPSALPPLAVRAPLFGRYLADLGADVVNFQEVWTPGALAVLRKNLPELPHVAYRRGLAGQPSGGLVTFSRRPVSVVRYASFRGTRPAVGSPRFRLKRMVNAALQGVLTVELTGLGVIVANTHLTANKDGDWSATSRYHAFQRAQLGVLHAAVRKARGAAPRPAILTGDFNISSESPLYTAILADGRWRDPFAGTDLVTFHAKFLHPGAKAHRIDYVLVSGDDVAVHEPRALFTEPEGSGTYLSDHMALAVRIELPSTVDGV